MKTVKHIIFDLGGVIINISSQRATRAFEELGVEHINDIYKDLADRRVLHDIETGQLTARDFCEKINQALDAPLQTTDIIRAWNKMLIDIPAERIDLLKSLKLNYDLFLLSNTDEIHIR